MCIAIIKPRGEKLPSRDHLESSFFYNSDGAGYALIVDDKVVYSKGYFNFEDYYNNLLANVGQSDTALLHMRITTHGGTSKELCHPFPITRDIPEMRETFGRTDAVLIHNGILSNLSSRTGMGVSDSMKLAQYIAKAGITQFNSRFFIKLVEPILGVGNKVAILTPRGFVKAGKGWIENKGCFYSNDTYEYGTWIGGLRCGYGGGLGAHNTPDPWEESYGVFNSASSGTKGDTLWEKQRPTETTKKDTEKDNPDTYETWSYGQYTFTSEQIELEENLICPACKNHLTSNLGSARVCKDESVKYVCNYCTIGWTA